MSMPIAIAAIVFADLALIALLTFVMSRAKLLSPHGAPAAESPARRQSARLERPPARPTRARASAIRANA